MGEELLAVSFNDMTEYMKNFELMRKMQNLESIIERQDRMIDNLHKTQ